MYLPCAVLADCAIDTQPPLPQTPPTILRERFDAVTLTVVTHAGWVSRISCIASAHTCVREQRPFKPRHRTT